MPEREADLGPYHAVRLSHLQTYHVLTATCLLCRHARRFRLWDFRGLAPPETYLTDIDKRLRCRGCGARGQARIIVTLADRNR